MFDVNQFVESCKGQSASAVKELLEDALRDPESIKLALAAVGGGKNLTQGGLGDMLFFRSPQLTVLKAAVPAGLKSPPHNHAMWAVIGVYDGQEDNFFYRRSSAGLEKVGGRELKAGEALVLGGDVIHAIENPLSQTTCAIHVYGGDLPSAQRSMWNPSTLTEEPYEFERLIEYCHQLMGQ